MIVGHELLVSSNRPASTLEETPISAALSSVPTQDHTRSSASAGLLRKTVAAFFPFFPIAGGVVAMLLVLATATCTILAWLSAFSGSGIIAALQPVPIFAALAFTGLMAAAAVLPRFTYRHIRGLNRYDESIVPKRVGAHIISVAMQAVLLYLASGPSGWTFAWVSTLGTLLWLVHDAAVARKISEDS